MKMSITPSKNEQIKWEELKIELAWLSREWDIEFVEHMYTGWHIIAHPKNNKKKTKLKRRG